VPVPIPLELPLVPVPLLLLLGEPTSLGVLGVLGMLGELGVLLGELMSGVPGVLGTPGVDGLPIDDPLLPGKPMLLPELLPGAPRPLTPKCELICWLHDESIVGQLVALKVGALCSLLWSTFNVNWSAPLCCTRLHGTATRLPLDELLDPMPLLDVDPIPELVDELVPMPLDDELLLPGAPADVPLNESTTN